MSRARSRALRARIASRMLTTGEDRATAKAAVLAEYFPEQHPAPVEVRRVPPTGGSLEAYKRWVDATSRAAAVIRRALKETIEEA